MFKMISSLFGTSVHADNVASPLTDRLIDMQGQLAAIDKAQAVIEFGVDGTILSANANFLAVMGYSFDEIRGKHHSMFVDPEHLNSAAYQQFWSKLARGEFDAGTYKRIGKNGKEVWIQATYNPIVDAQNKPYKVVKFATDVSEQKRKFADYEGQLAAIGKAQAVISFTLDGRIVDANENFLKTLGYSLTEIQGQHHSMFVDPAIRDSADYRAFWARLGRGEFDAGRYRRIGKNGVEVWIQATYNPIFDASGRPCKVVKYAVDVSEQVRNQQMLESVVAETQRVVEAAQRGDLTQRLSTQDKSAALAELSTGINALVSTTADLVGQVRQSSEMIGVAAREIAQGNTDLSGRTEQQASSLQETASSMEELTSTVRQNADNAMQANQLTLRASEVAVRGGEVVGQVVSTMEGIHDSARKIVDIIAVIDGIAFQTNILALNAAVEAARAGEQGRGFAVVATEVRTLAQRSAAAAKEIKVLISNSVEKVESGSRLVGTAGETMNEVVASVKRVSDIMSEISAASAEQSSGIEQINQAIGQMDEVTQQNAALVEQAAAASESLEDQVHTLVDAVKAFRIEAQSAAAPTGAAPQAERRAPDRARNVERLRQRPPAEAPVRANRAKTANAREDDWQSF